MTKPWSLSSVREGGPVTGIDLERKGDRLHHSGEATTAVNSLGPLAMGHCGFGWRVEQVDSEDGVGQGIQPLSGSLLSLEGDGSPVLGGFPAKVGQPSERIPRAEPGALCCPGHSQPSTARGPPPPPVT